MLFLSDNNQADEIEVTSRYLDDLLNIDNPGKSVRYILIR